MSVVINGMEMPINCPHCPCSDDQTRFCNAAKKYIPMLGKPKFCPLETIEERKKGKWIETDSHEPCWFKCDQCGRLSDIKEIYCPTCGASMANTTCGADMHTHF